MNLGRIAGLLLVVAAVGCVASDADVANGDDPLEALTVPYPSSRYTTIYWTQKSATDRDLWSQATTYCEGKADGDHPNCGAVRYVQTVERMSRLPKDRPNDFRLTVPQAAAPR